MFSNIISGDNGPKDMIRFKSKDLSTLTTSLDYGTEDMIMYKSKYPSTLTLFGDAWTKI